MKSLHDDTGGNAGGAALVRAPSTREPRLPRHYSRMPLGGQREVSGPSSAHVDWLKKCGEPYVCKGRDYAAWPTFSSSLPSRRSEGQSGLGWGWRGAGGDELGGHGRRRDGRVAAPSPQCQFNLRLKTVGILPPTLTLPPLSPSHRNGGSRLCFSEKGMHGSDWPAAGTPILAKHGWDGRRHGRLVGVHDRGAVEEFPRHSGADGALKGGKCVGGVARRHKGHQLGGHDVTAPG